MTATDELRALLDERGVEYEGDERSVRWRDRNGVMMQAFPLANGELGMDVWSCTPEQAVAATLGRGTCRNVHEPPKDTTFWPAPHFKCSECGATYVATDYAYYCPSCGREVVSE